MNMTFTLDVTLQGRLSGGEYVCASNCPMWDCCQNGLKMSEACPIRKWIKSQTAKGEPGFYQAPETTKSEKLPPLIDKGNPWPSRICNFLALHGMTQKDLGDLVGVHQTCVCSWKRGKTVPRDGVAKKLADVLRTFEEK